MLVESQRLGPKMKNNEQEIPNESFEKIQENCEVPGLTTNVLDGPSRVNNEEFETVNQAVQSTVALETPSEQTILMDLRVSGLSRTLWEPITEELRDHFITKGPACCQNNDGKFKSAARIYKQSLSGFSDWKHMHKMIVGHETSEEHIICMMDCSKAYKLELKINARFLYTFRARVTLSAWLAQELPSAARLLLIFLAFFNGCIHFFSLDSPMGNFDNSTGTYKKVVKRLSDTRWSARADAVTALINGYSEIQQALKKIAEDQKEERATSHEAESLSNKIDKLETAF
ncbi:hypothetical protein OUZ56_018807 [Daphnia magna]|uniref:Uncharacterized protein n=1 Tax=Daphnia magna TaxID=35525 RepID=A0ABQ9Z9T5_9CRUS|nr:hypothetical protein OUZ56_018807 [Daphnia magna]